MEWHRYRERLQYTLLLLITKFRPYGRQKFDVRGRSVKVRIMRLLGHRQENSLLRQESELRCRNESSLRTGSQNRGTVLWVQRGLPRPAPPQIFRGASGNRSLLAVFPATISRMGNMHGLHGKARHTFIYVFQMRPNEAAQGGLKSMPPGQLCASLSATAVRKPSFRGGASRRSHCQRHTDAVCRPARPCCAWLPSIISCVLRPVLPAISLLLAGMTTTSGCSAMTTWRKRSSCCGLACPLMPLLR